MGWRRVCIFIRFFPLLRHSSPSLTSLLHCDETHARAHLTSFRRSFRLPITRREQRAEWLARAPDLVGKALTVKYFQLSDDGVPRFPVGIALRDYE